MAPAFPPPPYTWLITSVGETASAGTQLAASSKGTKHNFCSTDPPLRRLIVARKSYRILTALFMAQRLPGIDRRRTPGRKVTCRRRDQNQNYDCGNVSRI